MTLRELCSHFDDEDLDIEVVINIPDSSGSYTQKGKKIINVEKEYELKGVQQEDGTIQRIPDPKFSKIVLTTTNAHQLGGTY